MQAAAPVRRGSASLNAAQRQRDLALLADGESVDLLVVGGGITGAGIALDAASRGLSVALLERRDLANGTSRWSSKLIHGGLRYLRQAEVGLAWESARERRILLQRTAPHLVRALPFLVPLNSAMSPTLGLLSEAGIRGGDLLRILAGSRGDSLPPPRRISGQEALRLAPGLSRSDLRGSILFWDGQVEDDARLVIAVARTAARWGARIVTRCAVERVVRGGAEVRDELTGERWTLHARHTINAAGVWAGELDPSVELRPSRGSHLIFDAADLGDPRAAVLTPVPGASARWVGATPASDGRVIVGVTDEDYGGPITDDPSVPEEEEEFLCDILSRALARPLRPEAAIGRFAGFRPLLAGAEGSTADLSRRHSLVDTPDLGLTTVVGGKLTTYRLMAEQAVDAALRTLGEPARRCRTHLLPLVGAARPEQLGELGAPERLVRRYGVEARGLLELARTRPHLLEPIADGVGVLGVELLFGLRNEGAITVDDLLDRRVRLGLVPEERRRAEAAAGAMVAAEAAA